MVNVVNCYMSMLQMMMKLAGMQPKEVEIEQGTIIHFWVRNTKNKKTKKMKKKPQVVLIHGFAGNGIQTWQFQILALRKKYFLYVPDLLFFGGSYKNSSDRSTKFQADCIAKGLKKLGVVNEKRAVVGFSYGGFVGFEMAQYYPELVGSLVVNGSVLAMTESITNNTLKRIGFSSWSEFLMPESVEGVKALLKILSYNNLSSWFPDFMCKDYLQVMYGNRKEKIELLEANVVKDEDVTTHQFQQRIILLWDANDEILNLEVANDLKERLGDDKAELKVLEKAGHLALFERPRAFNKCLKVILDSLSNGQ